jgi:hypothetical protein
LTGKYDGVHAFVFLREGDEVSPGAVIENLQRYINRQAGPVFFASRFEGDFQGFAHIAGDDARALGTFVGGDLWEAGIHSHNATEGQWHVNGHNQTMGPTRNTPSFIAICRVTVNQRPLLVMGNIASFFGDELDAYGQSQSPFIGASTVIADFHLLVELGDDDPEALSRHVQSLSRVDGVVGVEAAVAGTEATPAA